MQVLRLLLTLIPLLVLAVLLCHYVDGVSVVCVAGDVIVCCMYMHVYVDDSCVVSCVDH